MADKYSSFQELTQALRRDVDYRVTVIDRAAPVSVLAIHGGAIEPGTAEIARAIAGDACNLYVFEALVSPGFDQHVTSTHFDDPAAVAIVACGRLSISVHGFTGDAQHQACITGPHAQLNARMFDSLKATGLLDQSVANPSGKFLALEAANIVNRGAGAGVQLEISRSLRDLLRADADKLALFAAAVRQACAPPPSRKNAPKP